MRILGFGTYDVRSHPRVGVLFEGLRERGFFVREVDEPLNIGTAQRVKALSSPASAARFAAAVVKRWGRLIRRRAAYRGRNAPDAVLVGYLGHFDVLLARVLFPSTPIVLDHLIFASDTAKDRGLLGHGLSERFKSRLLKAIDGAALAAADVVVLDTADHRALLPTAARGKEVIVPVGAPARWFDAGKKREEAESRGIENSFVQCGAEEPVSARAGADEVSAGCESASAPDLPLSAVFFGLFTPLQGAPVIARALALLENRGTRIDVTLIGDGQDAQAVRETLPAGECVRVSWMDWVNSADLPGVVARHDVCLGIFGTSDKARRVVPNKVYQGLAAGCTVITSDTPPQRRALGCGALFVEPGNAQALADALEELAKAPSKGPSSKDVRESFRAARVTAPLDDILRRLCRHGAPAGSGGTRGAGSRGGEPSVSRGRELSVGQRTRLGVRRRR